MYKTSMPKESITSTEYYELEDKYKSILFDCVRLREQKIKAETKLRHIEQYFDDLDDIDYKTIKYEVEKILKKDK